MSWTVGVADEGGGFKYAMGWAAHPLFSQAGSGPTLPLVLDHTGDASNYHSVIALLPGLKRGAVLLMNSNDEVAGAGYFRLMVGIEQILAGAPVFPADYFSNNPVQQFGRQFYLALLVVESLWILVWAWTTRRQQRSNNRFWVRIRPTSGVLGLVFLISAVGSLWFVLPGMFDVTPGVMIRLLPDVAAVGLTLTAITGAWAILRAVLAASWFARCVSRSGA